MRDDLSDSIQAVIEAAERAAHAYGAKDGPIIPEMELLGVELAALAQKKASAS